jgi:Cytochrome c oxidase subunit IV
MRAAVNLFWVLAGFFILADIAYSTWALLAYGKVEWVGTLGIVLTAALSIFIGFFLYRSYKAQGGPLPEDRLDANIDDGDPEMGFFSPWSWWPLMLGLSAGLAFLALAVGFWLIFFAAALFIVSIIGWYFEYWRGNFAR